jgi:hypothetical protein
MECGWKEWLLSDGGEWGQQSCFRLIFAPMRPLMQFRSASLTVQVEAMPMKMLDLLFVDLKLAFQERARLSQVLKEDIRVAVTIFIGAGAQNRRWMQRCNNGR